MEYELSIKGKDPDFTRLEGAIIPIETSLIKKGIIPRDLECYYSQVDLCVHFESEVTILKTSEFEIENTKLRNEIKNLLIYQNNIKESEASINKTVSRLEDILKEQP